MRLTLIMAKPPSFSFFLLSLLIICSSGFLVGFTFIPGGAIISFLKQKTQMRRSLGDTTIITVPSSNPSSVTPTTPTNPATMPITVPSTNSPVPSVAYPPPSLPPPSVPLINPQPPSSTSTPSPTNTGTTGQRWCVAKSGVSQSALQSALDYACGIGAADCSQIQQGGRCYNPNTLQNHASYAFNSYYQKNPIPTSCDFGGTATLVNNNPSSGSCIYTSSSSSTPTSTSSTPTPTPTPTTPTSTSTSSSPTPTPTTTTTTPPSSPATGTFGYGSPPSVLNSTSPASSGFTPVFGSPSPPSVSSTTWSQSTALTPHLLHVVCTLLMMPLVTGSFTMSP